MNKRYLLLFLLFYSSFTIAQDKTFSKGQLQTDLDYLKNNLFQKHPNLFTYTSPEVIEQFFSDLSQNLPATATELEFYRLITPLSTLLKDGHTLFFPNDDLMNFHNAHSSFFPFQIHWDGKIMYTLWNYSEDEEIPDGSQIIDINGSTSADIMTYCLKRMMQDGNNKTYSSWVINNWFREYYSFFFGHPANYKITFKYPDGTMWSKDIRALGRVEIAKKRSSLYPALAKAISKEKTSGNGITLKMIPEIQTAILTIKDFHNKTLKKTYHQNFKKVIKKYFAEISENNIQNLILDLRNNQGGAIKNGKILLSHLMNQEFQLVEGYKKVDASKNNNQINRLKKSGGPCTGIYAPNRDRFKGKLFVLINGGSFSNSGIVAAVLKSQNRGIFIGEETGGSKNILAGNTKNIYLPNTKLQIQVPTLQFMLNSKDNPEKYSGTLPDHIIQAGIINKMDRKDVVMEYTHDLIRQKR